MSLCKRTFCLFKLLNRPKPGWSFNYNNLVPIIGKFCSTKPSQNPSERMIETLKAKFPLAKQIDVVDVSGGCGSMYDIYVESVEFKGLTMVKQHRLINEILKDDIKQMHGLRILTKIPDEKG